MRDVLRFLVVAAGIYIGLSMMAYAVGWAAARILL